MTARLDADGSEIFIDGAHYLWVLEQVHSRRAPRSYLEIGTLHGDTLRLSQTRSVAIDVKFRLRELKFDPARVALREMTSDDYFARHDPRQDLGHRIEFAFLDGMHEFPYLLRDFINTERHMAHGGVIAMHDCVPRDVYMTRMERELGVQRTTNYPGYWAGDVWKLVPVLRKYRPDLDLRCLDAPPTGLTVVANLDPKNRVLSDAYDEILRDWEALRLDDYGMATLFDEARIESAADWTLGLAPLVEDSFLRQVGRVVQPRRRLQKAMAAVGFGGR